MSSLWRNSDRQCLRFWNHSNLCHKGSPRQNSVGPMVLILNPLRDLFIQPRVASWVHLQIALCQSDVDTVSIHVNLRWVHKWRDKTWLEIKSGSKRFFPSKFATSVRRLFQTEITLSMLNNIFTTRQIMVEFPHNHVGNLQYGSSTADINSRFV